MIYLASPYSNADGELLEERYQVAMDITAYFIKEGTVIFSPIVHFHEMSKKYNFPGEFSFWERIDRELIAASSEVWFAMMPGYTKSVGMEKEDLIALELNKPRRVIVPGINNNWGLGHYELSTILTGDFLRDPE